VSTEALKQRMARLNPRILVVQNALHEQFLEQQGDSTGSGNSAKIVIGYMGTYSHDDDILMVLQALRNVITPRADEIEFQLIGGIREASSLRALYGVNLRPLEVGPNVEYSRFMRWMRTQAKWDLAIAPLVDTPFTRCKSDIKFLDYGILGIPGIYSKVAPYESTVKHLETGLLARNTVGDWTGALEAMISDAALRRRLGAAAREYVSSERTLSQCAHLWREAILSIVKSRGRVD